MVEDYDEYYDTKVSRTYESSKLGSYAGVVLIFTGLCSIVITIVDMFCSNFNQGQTQTDNTKVYTWDENPFWPTYGKGFWVGLILITTGIVGMVSSCENTLTSIYAFVAMCVSSAIFSFYMLISATIPVSKYSNYGSNSALSNVGSYYINSLAFNGILIALGGLGFIVSIYSAVVSASQAGCCKERRGYGGPFLEKFYRSVPASTPIIGNQGDIPL